MTPAKISAKLIGIGHFNGRVNLIILAGIGWRIAATCNAEIVRMFPERKYVCSTKAIRGQVLKTLCKSSQDTGCYTAYKHNFLY